MIQTVVCRFQLPSAGGFAPYHIFAATLFFHVPPTIPGAKMSTPPAPESLLQTDGLSAKSLRPLSDTTTDNMEDTQMNLHAHEEPRQDLEIVYLTGENAAGKTSLGRYIAEKYSSSNWQFIDGDEFVDSDPELNSWMKAASGKVISKMRGTFAPGEGDNDEKDARIIAEVKRHDEEVRAVMEPFFRAVFSKLKEQIIQESMPESSKKVIFSYHIWRNWTVDLFQTFFPEGKIIEVKVDRRTLLNRFVQREIAAGLDHEARWREDPGERFAMLRNFYGPEWKGNEENYKKFVEWRFYFYREPFWDKDADEGIMRADVGENIFVVNNDNFDAARELEKILELEKS
ncbi:unnamed protein product [Amoebophrya sp. A120]|nr:unnamed protein product [Amoebophrya sp. A120]|eukprot:GSA120T00015664001.1